MVLLTQALQFKTAITALTKIQRKSNKASDMMKWLDNRYNGNDVYKRVELKSKLRKLKLSKNGNPRDLFDEVENILLQGTDNQLSLNEDELLEIVAEVCDESWYSCLIEGINDGKVNIEHVKEKMLARHALKQLQKRDSESCSDEDPEYEGILVANEQSDDESDDEIGSDDEASNVTSDDESSLDDDWSSNDDEKSEIEEENAQSQCRRVYSCSHCGRKGHTESYCWDKHPQERVNYLRRMIAKEEAAVKDVNPGKLPSKVKSATNNEVTGASFEMMMSAYDSAEMKDKEKWIEAVKGEYERMVDNGNLKPVKKSKEVMFNTVNKGEGKVKPYSVSESVKNVKVKVPKKSVEFKRNIEVRKPPSNKGKLLVLNKDEMSTSKSCEFKMKGDEVVLRSKETKENWIKEEKNPVSSYKVKLRPPAKPNEVSSYCKDRNKSYKKEVRSHDDVEEFYEDEFHEVFI
jgi:hypothetical protein